MWRALPKRWFSDIRSLVEINTFTELPKIPEEDSDSKIQDVTGFFHYKLEYAAEHSKVPGRPLIRKTDFTKYILLA